MHVLPRDPRRALLLCSLAIAALLALAAGRVAVASAANTAYTTAVIADAPRAYWHLDETSSASAADATGHGNTLTGSGSVAADQPGPFAGTKAMTFSGGVLSRPYFPLTTASTAPAGSAPGDFTIEAWMRKDVVNAGADQYQRQIAIANGWVVPAGQADPGCSKGAWISTVHREIDAYDSDGCFQGSLTTPQPLFGTDGADWHHVVLQRASGVTTLYLDGVAQRGPDGHHITLTGGTFRLGWLQNAAPPNDPSAFKGSLSEVAYYDKALSPARIAAHYDAVASGGPSNVSAPTVSPDALIGPGVTLKAARGRWAAGTPSFAYQWQRCDAAGTSCADVVGATASTYPLGADDVGTTLRVRVTATSALGSASASSATTAPVSFQKPRGHAAYAQAVLDDAPLSYWPLADSSPWWVDDVTDRGYALTGAGTPPNRQAGPFAGAFALRFDGSSHRGRPYLPYSDNFAMEFWVKSDKVAENQAPVSNGWVDGSNCTHGIEALVNAADVFSYNSVTCSNGAATARQTVFATTADWHHVVVQRASGTTLLYVDGALQTGAGTNHAITINNGSFRLGGIQGGNSATALPFKGSLSEVAFYDHTLTATRIAAHRDAAIGAPTADTRPTVAPSAVVYETDVLTAAPGTWSGPGTLTPGYAWEACGAAGDACAAIAGATGATYTPTDDEVGKRLRVVVTMTSSATGASAPATSALTGVVREASPANVNPPSIVRSKVIDFETLYSTPGSWTGKPQLTNTRQWQRCDADGDDCADVPGATSTIYPLTSVDVGHRIRVVVTVANAAGSATAASAASDVVAAVAPESTQAPEVSGEATELATLSSTLGGWHGTTPMGYTRQWQRCDAEDGGDGATCEDIPGATGDTYTSTGDDVGHTVRVVVTATNVAGSGARPSAVTAVVAPAAS